MTYSFTQISQYLQCPRKYRYRYLDGWREKEDRASMIFGRCFENALAAYFREEDSTAVFFKAWQEHQDAALQYAKNDSWDRLYHQGVRLLERFAQDDRVRIRQPKKNLQVKFTRRLPCGSEFVSYVDAIGELNGTRCILDWKTTGSRYPEQPEGLSGLLFLDDRYRRCRPSGVRSQEHARNSIPEDIHRRRTAPGVWPAGGNRRGAD